MIGSNSLTLESNQTMKPQSFETRNSIFVLLKYMRTTLALLTFFETLKIDLDNISWNRLGVRIQIQLQKDFVIIEYHY